MDNEIINLLNILTPLALVLVLFVAVLFIKMSATSEIKKKDNTAPDRSGYKYYLNGKEVNPGNVDLLLYKYSYNDEEHVVYMTEKSQHSTTNGFLLGFIGGFFTGKTKHR